MPLNRTNDYDCGNADNDESNPKDKPSPISHACFYPLRPVATHHALTLVLTVLPAIGDRWRNCSMISRISPAVFALGMEILRALASHKRNTVPSAWETRKPSMWLPVPMFAISRLARFETRSVLNRTGFFRCEKFP